MPVDPHELALAPRETDTRHREVVERDRPCRSCGYNLVGLPIGGKCSECGAEVTKREPKAPPDEATQAPLSYARTLWAGSTLLTFGAIATGGVEVALWIQPDAADAIGVVAIALWLGGATLMLLPRPAPPPGQTRNGDWWILRGVSAATQACWAGVMLVVIFAPATAQGGFWASVEQGLTALGLLGLAPFFWLLGNIASWSNDYQRGYRTRAFAVGAAPLTGIFALLALNLLPPLNWVAAIFLFPLVILFYTYGLWSLWQMSRTLNWACVNIETARAQQRRRREKFERERAAAAAEAERNRPFGGPLPPG